MPGIAVITPQKLHHGMGHDQDTPSDGRTSSADTVSPVEMTGFKYRTPVDWGLSVAGGVHHEFEVGMAEFRAAHPAADVILTGAGLIAMAANPERAIMGMVVGRAEDEAQSYATGKFGETYSLINGSERSLSTAESQADGLVWISSTVLGSVKLGAATKFVAAGAITAKRGPKTDPLAPHNATIRSEAQRLRDEGNEIIAGGGGQKETLIPTPGGYKSGRRPDILYRTPQGELRGLNVGRTKANGEPVTREQRAIEDLKGAGVETDFTPYDR